MPSSASVPHVRVDAPPDLQPAPARWLSLPRTADSATHSLSPGASFLLDLTRLTAALMVVAAHLGHPEFATGFANRQILGDIAVPVFFVLSGFVIRYVTLAREHTLREFLIDRAARVYSVALPAMLLTIALAFFCARVAPVYYRHHFAAISDHPIARVLLNLSFLSQAWGHNTVALIDSPFWSLSYECLYYAGYGLAFYLRGWRRAMTLCVWAAFAGPQVLFLLPIWWLGAVVYDVYHALRRYVLTSNVLKLSWLCLVLCLAAVAFGTPHRTAAPLNGWSSLPNPLLLLHIEPMRATMMAFGIGCVAALALLLVLPLADAIALEPGNLWLRRFRRLADGTFAIYLMHYPLMVLVKTLGLLRPFAPVLNLATTAAICLLLIAAAGLIDSFKDRLKHLLRAIISARSATEPESTPRQTHAYPSPPQPCALEFQCDSKI
jgi:peptidoglycan/LPS O-acetylase OafA/YrhL